MNILEKELYSKSDKKQQEFLSKLVPTIEKKLILGVKNPIVRDIAKKYYKTNEKECVDFIKKLPHKYLEEYILHSSIMEQIKDYNMLVKEIDKWLPYVDNWATCDTFSPKLVKKHLRDFYKNIKRWIKSKHNYTIRFSIQMFMSFYLDKDKNDNIDIKEMTDIISKIRYKSKYKYDKESQTTCPDKYYVDMMIAWFFATLLVKDYKLAFSYIKNKKLETWTHNKAIQKACESYRISEKQKQELKKYKK
ncbi:MAG: DNA alkylation repair protein [Lachnospiraceae bacterium]|nr:DNA alkylation repair protein [Lachnospiraceae bacterium]